MPPQKHTGLCDQGCDQANASPTRATRRNRLGLRTGTGRHSNGIEQAQAYALPAVRPFGRARSLGSRHQELFP
jgi:hypothetical protein